MYSPTTGRFLTRDPIGYPDGMNAYAGYHAMNSSTDPIGLSCTRTCSIITQLEEACALIKHTWSIGGIHKQHREKNFYILQRNSIFDEISSVQSLIRKNRANGLDVKFLNYQLGELKKRLNKTNAKLEAIEKNLETKLSKLRADLSETNIIYECCISDCNGNGISDAMKDELRRYKECNDEYTRLKKKEVRQRNILIAREKAKFNLAFNAPEGPILEKIIDGINYVGYAKQLELEVWLDFCLCGGIEYANNTLGIDDDLRFSIGMEIESFRFDLTVTIPSMING